MLIPFFVWWKSPLTDSIIKNDIIDECQGTFLRQGSKMRERPKSSLGFFRSVYCKESSPKFQMYNEQKANGALIRENQNANNKSAEKT